MTDICANCKHMVIGWLCGKTATANVCKVTGLKTYETPLKKCVDVRGVSDRCNLRVKECVSCNGVGTLLCPGAAMRCKACGGCGIIRD